MGQVQAIRDKCTILQLNQQIAQLQLYQQISSEDFRISDLLINNNLTISPTTHNHHLHLWCPPSLPLARVKDSVVTSSESIISHQVFQKRTSWRSNSSTPSTTSVLHCLRNVKNLGQHSLIQEQWHELLLNHLFFTPKRSQRPSPMSRCQACHLHHRQSHHSCGPPHCRRRQESSHWSRRHRSQSSSSVSS